jgi:hypothetical protein
MTDIVVDPLRRFPVFRTSGPEELRHFGSTLFGAAGIVLTNTGSFEVRASRCKQQQTGLAFCCSARTWPRSAEAGLNGTTCRFLSEYPNWVGPLLRT